MLNKSARTVVCISLAFNSPLYETQQTQSSEYEIHYEKRRQKYTHTAAFWKRTPMIAVRLNITDASSIIHLQTNKERPQ